MLILHFVDVLQFDNKPRKNPSCHRLATPRFFCSPSPPPLASLLACLLAYFVHTRPVASAGKCNVHNSGDDFAQENELDDCRLLDKLNK